METDIFSQIPQFLDVVFIFVAVLHLLIGLVLFIDINKINGILTTGKTPFIYLFNFLYVLFLLGIVIFIIIF